MNTAEPSGDESHSAGPDSRFPGRPRTAGRSARASRLSRLTPATRNSLLVIVSLYALFVAADVTLTQGNTESRIDLAAAMIAAGLDNTAIETAEKTFAPIARALDASMLVTVTDRNDIEILHSNSHKDAQPAALLPEFRATRAIAGPLGTVEVRQSRQDALMPVLLRALAALGLAGLLAARTLRRIAITETRRCATTLAAAMDGTTDGLAIWDGNNVLVATAGTIADAALVPPSLLRRGALYDDFHSALAEAGELVELSDTATDRRLHVKLGNGDAWELREHITRDRLRIMHFIDDSARLRLGSEVSRLRMRIDHMANELQTQRVRGDAASRSKTLFLSQLSHSLRTPLNHIIGFADLLHHQSFGPIGDGRYLSYAGNIKQSGQALLDKLANMLELAEFDSGERVLNREPIRLCELFDWTEMRYQEQARRAGIEIALERSDDIVVLGDRLGLRRLIGSIIDNSLKFTPSGGSITMAAWHSSDGVVLEFTDTGIGIHSDTLTVLNTSFTLSNDRRGNGIAIARAIAELSGGQLQINSSPGIGTTVAVVLPIRIDTPTEIISQQVA